MCIRGIIPEAIYNNIYSEVVTVDNFDGFVASIEPDVLSQNFDGVDMYGDNAGSAAGISVYGKKYPWAQVASIDDGCHANCLDDRARWNQ